MTNQILIEAQEYLTVAYEDRKKRILDLKKLVLIHPPEVIISFLRNLLEDKKKVLKEAIARDKSNPEINEIVSTMFRIYMAIRCIEEEVMNTNEFKQGTGGSGRVFNRNSCRDRGPGVGKDKNNDGEDRKTGQVA